MELLLEIREEDLGIEKTELSGPMELRRAARAVIFNDKDEVALVDVSRKGYHKIPGGGVEDGEELEEALEREAMEEAGVKIEVERELGMTVEYRNRWQEKQESYCYIARATGPPKGRHLDTEEEEDGFEILWVPLDKAIEIAEADKLEEYGPKFMGFRDLFFLKKAKEVLGK